MKVYNTLSRSKEEFVPLKEGEVKMYVCGPTVYNLIHIGNARPMIVFDTVRRYFIYKGYQVNFVSNFTDVDDKIIQKANQEGVDSTVISSRYIAECKNDMKALNVLPATVHPKATEEIDGMLAMIDTLEQKGHAYAVSDGTVYFRTNSFKDYGKLSHKDMDELQSGLRELKVSGEEKENSSDFVLWKPKKEGEPYWDSKWSKGRPGWHIECSVMSKKYLGDQIDIHAGGEDLIFPHHENEIAQSEATSGKEFAKYWMHNGFLNIDNKKMSKSLGNFFTVRDISEKYDLQVLRFFMLTAHYRGPLNFSAELMESAKNSLERILVGKERLDAKIEGLAGDAANTIKASKSANEVELKKALQEAGESIATEKLKESMDLLFGVVDRFQMAMEDDFNTADAITALFDLVKLSNTSTEDSDSTLYLLALANVYNTLADILGLRLERTKEDLDGEVEELIAARQAARKAKDFAKADAIRNQLLDMGIVLEDTREGVKWKRV